MNGAKHTPGPWAVDSGGGIIQLRTQRVIGRATGQDWQEQHANACLQAAGPDFKAALQLCVRAFEARGLRALSEIELRAYTEARDALALVRASGGWGRR
jgi:hypothetical protein